MKRRIKCGDIEYVLLQMLKPNLNTTIAKKFGAQVLRGLLDNYLLAQELREKQKETIIDTQAVRTK
jgi:hypothetical protein